MDEGEIVIMYPGAKCLETTLFVERCNYCLERITSRLYRVIHVMETSFRDEVSKGCVRSQRTAGVLCVAGSE